MSQSVVSKIYPLLYKTVREYSKHIIDVSEKELRDIVLFLAAMGFYEVNQKSLEAVLNLSRTCQEFVEDYSFVRFLVPELKGVAACNIALSHQSFSLALYSEYGLFVPRTEGIAILSFAVKSNFVIFGQHAKNKLIVLHDPKKLCRFIKSCLLLRQCFPNEPIHKTCLRAI